ncbi:MAG: hypothetical protein JSS07_07750 [Proteobacteria bacterium]|nr:hypothetical protein [Pseudomonadota bacterium]
MRRKIIFILIICFSLLGQLQASSSSALQATAAGLQGTISAVDVTYKTIQIGEKTYGLADGIQVYSMDNELLNQYALAAGQKIEYDLAKQPLNIQSTPPLPSQVVTNIRILSGTKKNKIPT